MFTSAIAAVLLAATLTAGSSETGEVLCSSFCSIIVAGEDVTPRLECLCRGTQLELPNHDAKYTGEFEVVFTPNIDGAIQVDCKLKNSGGETLFSYIANVETGKQKEVVARFINTASFSRLSSPFSNVAPLGGTQFYVSKHRAARYLCEHYEPAIRELRKLHDERSVAADSSGRDSDCVITTNLGRDLSNLSCLVGEQESVPGGDSEYTGKFKVEFRPVESTSIQVDCKTADSTDSFLSYTANLATENQQKAVKKFIKKDGSFTHGLTSRRFFSSENKVVVGGITYLVSKDRAARYLCEHYEALILPSETASLTDDDEADGSRDCSFSVPEGKQDLLVRLSCLPNLREDDISDTNQENETDETDTASAIEGKVELMGGNLIRVTCTQDGDSFTYTTNAMRYAKAVDYFIKSDSLGGAVSRFASSISTSMGGSGTTLGSVFESRETTDKDGKTIKYLVSDSRATLYVCERYGPFIFGAASSVNGSETKVFRTCHRPKQFCSEETISPRQGKCSITFPLYEGPASISPEPILGTEYDNDGFECLTLASSRKDLPSPDSQSKKSAKVGLVLGSNPQLIRIECFNDEGKMVLAYQTGIDDRGIDYFVKEPTLSREFQRAFQDLPMVSGNLAKDFNKMLQISEKSSLWLSERRAQLQVCDYYQLKIDSVLNKVNSECEAMESNPNGVVVLKCMDGALIFTSSDCNYKLLNFGEVSDVYDFKCPEVVHWRDDSKFAASSYSGTSGRYTCQHSSIIFGYLWLKPKQELTSPTAISACRALYSLMPSIPSSSLDSSGNTEDQPSTSIKHPLVESHTGNEFTSTLGGGNGRKAVAATGPTMDEKRMVKIEGGPNCSFVYPESLGITDDPQFSCLPPNYEPELLDGRQLALSVAAISVTPSSKEVRVRCSERGNDGTASSGRELFTYVSSVANIGEYFVKETTKIWAAKWFNSLGIRTMDSADFESLTVGDDNYHISNDRAARYLCDHYRARILQIVERPSYSSLSSVGHVCTNCVRKEFSGCTLVFYPTTLGVEPVLEDIRSCEFLEEGNPDEDIPGVEANQRVTDSDVRIDCTDEALSNEHIFASFFMNKFVPKERIFDTLPSWLIGSNSANPQEYSDKQQKHFCSQLRKQVRRYHKPTGESCWFNLPDIGVPIGIELALHCLPTRHESLGTDESTGHFSAKVTVDQATSDVTVRCLRSPGPPNQFFTYQTNLKISGVEESVLNFLKPVSMWRDAGASLSAEGKLNSKCDKLGEQYVCNSAAAIDVCDRYGPTIFSIPGGGRKQSCSFKLPEGLSVAADQSSLPCLPDSKGRKGKDQKYGGRFTAVIQRGNRNGEVRVVCTRDENQFTYITNFESQQHAVRIFMKPKGVVSGLKKMWGKLTGRVTRQVPVLSNLFQKEEVFKNSKGHEVRYQVSPERAAKFVCEHYRPMVFGATNKRTCPNQSLCTHDEFEPSSGYCSFKVALYGDPASMADTHRTAEGMATAYEKKGLSCLEYEKSSGAASVAPKPADSKKSAKVSIIQQSQEPFVKVECFDDGYEVFTYTTSLFDKNIRFFVKEEDSNMVTKGVVQGVVGLGNLSKYFDMEYNVNGRTYRTSSKRASVQVCELYQPKVDLVLSDKKNRCTLLENKKLPERINVWACNDGRILRVGQDCSYTLEDVFVPRTPSVFDKASISFSDTFYLKDRIKNLNVCPRISGDASAPSLFTYSVPDPATKRLSCNRSELPFGSIWIKDDGNLGVDDDARSVCSSLYSTYWNFYPKSPTLYRTGKLPGGKDDDVSEITLSSEKDVIIFRSSETFPLTALSAGGASENNRYVNKESSRAKSSQPRTEHTEEEDDGASLCNEEDDGAEEIEVDEDTIQVNVVDDDETTGGSSSDETGGSNEKEPEYKIEVVAEPVAPTRSLEELVQVVELPSVCQSTYYPPLYESFLKTFYGSNPITKDEYKPVSMEKISKTLKTLQKVLDETDYGRCLTPDKTKSAPDNVAEIIASEPSQDPDCALRSVISCSVIWKNDYPEPYKFGEYSFKKEDKEKSFSKSFSKGFQNRFLGRKSKSTRICTGLYLRWNDIVGRVFP